MRTVLLTILFAFLCIASADGETKNLYYELGARGYELVLDMRYDEADKIFDEMIRMEPENAAGYLYKSQSFFHYWQYTYLNPDHKTLKEFKSLLYKTKAIAEKGLDQDNIVTLFVLGSAYGNIGLYHANTNNWFRAWWYGRKGIKYVEKVIEKEPGYSNAYFLLGMYNYYAATLPKVIKSLSFLLGGAEGDREKGIEQLILASSKGELKGDAKTFLADSVYFYEKNYEAALALLKKLTAEYPNNHYLSLILGASYLHLNKYDLSVRVLNSSLQSESLKKYPYLHGDVCYTLGLAFSRMNKYDQAISAHKTACEISKELDGFIPDHYDAWSLYEIGNAYEMLGSVDLAHEYYSAIKEDNREAYKHARARIEKPLTQAEINLIKGKNYLRYASYLKAETIFKELIDSEFDKESTSNSFKAETCLCLGEVEYHLEKYQDSIRTLNKVFTFNNVTKEGIGPWSHYWLACCYCEMGDTQKARQEYDMAYMYNDNEIRARIDKFRSKLSSLEINPD